MLSFIIFSALISTGDTDSGKNGARPINPQKKTARASNIAGFHPDAANHCEKVLRGVKPHALHKIRTDLATMRQQAIDKPVRIEVLDDGLVGIQEDKMVRKTLSSQFESFSDSRRALGIKGVNKGEALYRWARLQAKIDELPWLLSSHERNLHPYWEIAVQAFVVSAAHSTEDEIAVVSATMAYLLHDIDDIADHVIPELLAHLNWDELEDISIEEFLHRYYKAGYDELYRILVRETKKVIPDFDEEAFGRATLRMIRGGVLLNPKIDASARAEFRRRNKAEHLELIKDRHPSLYRFLLKKVHPFVYAYTVKSLSDGICAFFGKDFDPGLMTSLGMLTLPGLLYQDFLNEMDQQEMVHKELISLGNIRGIVSGTEVELLKGIEAGEFRREDVEKIRLILLAYGDGFKKVLEPPKNLLKRNYLLAEKLKKFTAPTLF
jgi:hypothetical protein